MQSDVSSIRGLLADGLGAIWWMYQLKSWKNADLKIYVFSFLSTARSIQFQTQLVTEA